MNYLMIFYYTLDFILFSAFILRVFYKCLPCEKLFINAVTYKCDYKNNLLYLRFFITIKSEKDLNKTIVKMIVLNKKKFIKKSEYINIFCDLKGNYINNYYIPFFKKNGYLDSELLLIPIFIYALTFIAFTIPSYILYKA